MPDVYFPVHSEQSARLGTLHGVRVREDSLYTNRKGEEKKGIRKGAEKALGALQGILGKVLQPEEAVLYIVRCQPMPSAGAQMMRGLSTYLAPVLLVFLVFTNRRLLRFGVAQKRLFARRLEWKRALRVASWGDIEEARVKGWLSSTLNLRYRNGQKETYWRISRKDGDNIKLLLNAVTAAGGLEVSNAQGMASLCPDCQTVLTPQVYQCSRCGLAFKDESKALHWSLLIPGGGYFYLGHRAWGLGALIAEGYLMVLFVIFLLVAFGMPDPLTDPGEAPLTAGQGGVAAGFMLGILGLLKWFNIRQCGKFVREFIPAK